MANSKHTSNTNKKSLVIALFIIFLTTGYFSAKLGVFSKQYTSIREHLSSDYNKYHFFLQPPKTGSSGLRIDIFKKYPRDKYASINKGILNNAINNDPSKCYNTLRHPNTRYIAGHFLFGAHCDIKNFTYSTILREPMSRLWSYFKFFVYDKVEGTMSPEEAWKFFMEKDFPTRDNDSVRRLSGVGRDVPIGGINETHLELAKRNLDEHFIAIGVLEDYRKYQLMLGHIMDIEMDLSIHANKGKHKLSKDIIPKKDWEELKEMNKHDTELYEYAKKRSEEIFATMPDSVKKKYEEITRK